MEFILPILIFVVLAIAAGVILTSLAKKFPGKSTDDEVAVRECLPGLNCGVCGYAGCDEYAHKLVTERVAPNACKPGGVAVAKKISDLTGIPFSGVDQQVAVVHCSGSYISTTDKYDYRGALSCAASARFYGGRTSCVFGCIGLGDCVDICPNGAIKVENGCAKVNPSLCTGCMMCASRCPKGIISAVPKSASIYTLCHSTANAKETIKVCKTGCISCKRCEKACPYGAIKVTNNFPEIDYSLCQNCGKCVEVCPRGCLLKLEL